MSDPNVHPRLRHIAYKQKRWNAKLPIIQLFIHEKHYICRISQMLLMTQAYFIHASGTQTKLPSFPSSLDYTTGNLKNLLISLLSAPTYFFHPDQPSTSTRKCYPVMGNLNQFSSWPLQLSLDRTFKPLVISKIFIILLYSNYAEKGRAGDTHL